MTDIYEIAPDLFRLSIYVPEFDMQFNHFLVRDEEPLLFHAGFNKMFPILREAVAAFKMAHESPGQTLQPTALVHEAWLRLVGNERPTFNNRAHFFHTASEAMRRILIDRARRRRAERHGGGYVRVEFDGFDPAAPDADDQLLAVHEAVDKLALEHPVQAQLVKLKYFAGMTNEEVSEVMGVSVATVKNYWTFSRAWLLNEIDED